MGFFVDLFGLKYSRWVHLMLLILLLILNITVFVLFIVNHNTILLRIWFSTLNAILFVLLWILRGLKSLEWTFPCLHYITVEFELVAHIIS